MIITINDDLTSNVTTDDGLLECNLPAYNPETLLPFNSKEEAESFANTVIGNPNYFITKLTDEQKAQLSADAALATLLASRAAEYPPMTDYLDGIVKGDTAQVQAYIDACLAVKLKWLKPE